MGNLFSSFDPQTSIMGINLSLNWISAVIVIFVFPQVYWLAQGQMAATVNMVVKLLSKELMAVFGSFCIPGTSLLFLSYFFFIMFSNFMGLFPYVFTASSHLVLTLSLSLPLWLGSMVWSLVFQFNSMMAHLVPSGTPGALMPVMVIIETVSSVIRPFTLAIRLAANMIAGHLLLTLLGSQGSMSIAMLSVLIALVLLLMLECAVACIQSYVFTILSSLYLNELLSVDMTKKSL
uniref:ATP synthase subunit a n=1 Tax=Lovenula raynerae TaxID=2487506 RepID=A0A3G4YLH9_9MAXI|nr:ATP synthase subunit 6 [Lovenula raynerae]